MSALAGPVFTNVHQIGNTLAWCFFYDIAVVLINMRYIKSATNAHALLGWCMLILTYIDILIFLIPNGYNISVANNSLLLEIHGIIGLCMMAFVVLQVTGGIIIRLQLTDKSTQKTITAKIKSGHRYFGYFLALLYKVNIIWCWIPSWVIVGILVLWEAAFITIMVYLKNKMVRLSATIVDQQIDSAEIRKISSAKQLESLTHSYVIFANYVYEARELLNHHPGGSKVIDTILNREVDRFLYGMYSSELLPELAPHSHSSKSLRFVGKPIAQLVVPHTYQGFSQEIVRVGIGSVHKISEKTQIYELELTPFGTEFIFTGYSNLQQLGQYYSLTLDDQITRLYTAVNFLNHQNVELMLTLIHDLKSSELFKDTTFLQSKQRDTQLSELKHDGPKANLQQKLLNKSESGKSKKNSLPLMLKIYGEGKMTSALRDRSFNVTNLKLSCPRGRGLELDSTSPGRIIVLAGGTGLFPFCDLIDLLYKAHILSENHENRNLILAQSPILQDRPFSPFTFVFLIALNEPDDIHPITLHQLLYLSQRSGIKIVMRISKNAQVISSLKSKIEFTRDYFTKRVLSEAGVEGLSRIWICGPPKLNGDTAASLLQNGFNRDVFLLV